MSRIMKASILVYSFYLLISFICEVFRRENYFNLFYRTYIKERCHHAVLKAHFEENKIIYYDLFIYLKANKENIVSY